MGGRGRWEAEGRAELEWIREEGEMRVRVGHMQALDEGQEY